MIEVYALIYLSSGKCYTYIMCHVWLWVSVFQQACGVLWLLNLLVSGIVWCCLYVWACTYMAWGMLVLCSTLAVGDVVSECRLNHYWPVHCGPWGFRGLWPLGTRGLYRLGSAWEWVFYCGGGIGYGIVHMARVSFGYLCVWVESQYHSMDRISVGFEECVGHMLFGGCCFWCNVYALCNVCSGCG